MRGTRLVITLILLSVPAAFPAEETKTPSLEIFSRLGKLSQAKLYNSEPVIFFARRAGAAGGPLLRGVKFILYDEGGDPATSECVRKKTEDTKRWGRPPSSFAYPVPGLLVPVGRYRLRAVRKGFRPAEIRLTVARLIYFDLKADRDKDSYRASFRLELNDVTLPKKPVTLEMRVETAAGGLVDRRKVVLGAVVQRAGRFETSGRVRLSSRRKKPDMKSPASARTGVLKVIPGSVLVLVLDQIRFKYPIPLPPEPSRGSQVKPGGLGRGGRGR